MKCTPESPLCGVNVHSPRRRAKSLGGHAIAPGSQAHPMSSSSTAECRASVLHVTGKDHTGHHGRSQHTVASSHPHVDRGWIGGVAHFGRSPDGCSILAPRPLCGSHRPGQQSACLGGALAHRPQGVYLHVTARKTCSTYWSRKEQHHRYYRCGRMRGREGGAALAVIGF